MRRSIAALVALTLVASVGLSAAAKKYGKPPTLKDTTKGEGAEVF